MMRVRPSTVRAVAVNTRMVKAQAHSVDAACGKSKLQRMRKAELAEACEEYGLESKGKKDTLVKNLIRHFESESQEDEIAPGEVVTHNQSAAVMTKPKMSISPMSHPISLGVDDLKDRIEALDETISVRTNELEGLRSADKEELEALAADHDSMRTQFEDKLGQLEAAMSGMKELQASSGKISALQAEQAELKETVGSLERLLKQRDDELSGLTAQLQAVRSEREAEREAVSNERLALVALGSRAMTASEAAAPVQQAPRTSRFAAVDPRNMTASSKDVVASLSAALASSAATSGARMQAVQGETSSVFGLALPGLVAVGTAQKAFYVYAALRDSIVSKAHERVTADVVAVSLALAAVMAASA